MKVEFTFDEYVYNGGGLKGAKIYHSEDDTLHTIDYVKLTKDSRQIKVHCELKEGETEAEVFLANQDDPYFWEVNTEREDKKVTKAKSKRKRK